MIVGKFPHNVIIQKRISSILSCLCRNISYNFDNRTVNNTPISSPSYSTKHITTTTTSKGSSSTTTADIKDSHEDWEPIYRLSSMPFIQGISRSKFAITLCFVVGSPVTFIASIYTDLPTTFVHAFIGSTLLSVCSLAAFSYFSTKLIGVVSVNSKTGLIRIGHLTFWGRRQNTILTSDQIVPPTDFNDLPEKCKTVRIGILSSEKKFESIQKIYFLTNLHSMIIDNDKFLKLFGFMWEKK